MSDDEVFQEYKQSIQRLRDESISAGITNQEFDKIYSESIKSIIIKKKNDRLNNYISRKICTFSIILVILVLIVYNFKFLQSCLICNIQEYTYPGLRLLRKASIPLISLFPSLTGLYTKTIFFTQPITSYKLQYDIKKHICL